ncbi:hypothetical protein BGW36DRAFT_376571 [Talaromyces proteolyticus]|uniref:DUF1445 domain protein n=1 Tax=Talaromyces proteolyticus TaxID=1131652 RepID=A0AAD4Q1F7_9EURO|nr:uncharacterized protein BGW36DRAFT_376571 [Talaromyces proteolyticus]KAH8698669.1 hypothetical protein BGW36DRAFT_376571 [Talaromyces proteolyticus]
MSPSTTFPASTGSEVRLSARRNDCTSPTAGLAPGYLQANMIILPSRYANDFRSLCARNPVPCPLIGESSAVGRFDAVKSYISSLSSPSSPTKNKSESVIQTNDLDLRRDVGRYMVYQDAEPVKTGCLDIVEEWTSDHVAFLIGCSYSFETALINAGLPPPHVLAKRNVAMYRTTIPLCPAGVFTGSTYVVSMRAYNRADLSTVREITSKYHATHGEPIAWGWDALKKLGIKSIDIPDWGDSPVSQDGRPLASLVGSETVIPVFWGCGVTPQEAVMRAGLKGVVMAHLPGHMLLLDCVDEDIL